MTRRERQMREYASTQTLVTGQYSVDCIYCTAESPPTVYKPLHKLPLGSVKIKYF